MYASYRKPSLYPILFFFPFFFGPETSRIFNFVAECAVGGFHVARKRMGINTGFAEYPQHLIKRLHHTLSNLAKIQKSNLSLLKGAVNCRPLPKKLNRRGTAPKAGFGRRAAVVISRRK